MWAVGEWGYQRFEVLVPFRNSQQGVPTPHYFQFLRGFFVMDDFYVMLTPHPLNYHPLPL